MSLHKEKADSDDPNPLGLDEVELACLSSQIDLPASTVGYGAIYRYANRLDLLVMIFSGVAACAAGSTMPLMTVRFLRKATESLSFAAGANLIYL